ncbi:helix-turn-helix domain-containing protein [uncultured Xylophilus sp.]|uniref:helix-turn-helix transcriptional regulator n=1 Tax=uncultured Xylophilus sp. TaxID=296832 RepID=UPI0025ED4617|nr:helix-turn-helix domain-containing protein [uncultured Xylophilus sp.]
MNQDDTDAEPAARLHATCNTKEHNADNRHIQAVASRLAYPRMLSSAVVAELAGWSRRTLYNRIRDGVFPAAIVTGPRTRAWLESDVLAFIEAQRLQRDERMHRRAAQRAAEQTNGAGHD